MGRSRKRFNWKARLQHELQKEKSVNEEGSVEVHLNVHEEKYDESNKLVLLPQSVKKAKKQGKPVESTQKILKPLSKKQKRKFAKILERSKKKIDRVELLEKLKEVQASSEELQLMVSTSSMQTCGFKKQIADPSMEEPLRVRKINNVKGSKKIAGERPMKKAKLDPNVVGYDEEESTTDSEDEEDSDIDEANMHSEQKLKEKPGSLSSVYTSGKNEDEGATKDALFVPESGTNAHSKIGKADDVSKPSGVLKEKKLVEPAVYIPVNRSPEIQAIRESLPIYSEEHVIMEAIKEHPVVIIHGATGTGKTTQVPQFLYEAGFTRDKKLIGITEPRRIAAVQMATRVAKEMNLPDAVSYHIRYEKTATDDRTEIKFMTDGVLLKEIRHDFLLTRYSVIIVDEAHERSVFSDVLIGLLSRILPLREKKGNPLKLIIMSATLRVDDFTENPRLFMQKPFLITLDSRQYDVILHFNRRTPVDYVQAAYDKVCKIHRKLPSGSILVFVTGEKEVTRLSKLLRQTFRFNGVEDSSSKTQALPDLSEKKRVIPENRRMKSKNRESFSSLPPKIDLNDYSIEPLDNEGLQHQESDDDEISDSEEQAKKFPRGPCEPLYVLPLYSVLPTSEQVKVFEPPPAGCRLCVVATNVAETSVTIPGLKYVVDTGKVKTRVYDKISGGVSNFAITWISKASASQRAGRAGRTEGGHCYRLYSSAIFEHEFPEFTPPDIKNIPVDDMLLQMKALGIDRVVNFPFPTPPDVEALKAAEKRLVKLGALEDLKEHRRFKDIAKWEYSAKITPFGKAMARFPLSPCHAKMLLLSYKHDVISLIIAAVSALTVPEVFLLSETNITEESKSDEGNQGMKLYHGIKKIGAGQGKSLKLGDVTVLLRAVSSYAETKNKTQLCIKYNIRHKAMVEIQKMRMQLIREMNRAFNNLNLPVDLKLEPPTDDEIEKVRKILASSMTDRIARRIPTNEEMQVEQKNAYKCLDLEEAVYIHPSSVLAKELPEFVVYQEIFKTSKLFMRTVTEIEPEWLAAFAPNLCEFSAPLETPSPYYDKKSDQIMCSMTATFGPWGWQLPCVVMAMPMGIAKYTWFCFFFLDGQICPSLKEYKNYFLSPASVILKQWARLLPRTRSIIQAVVDEDVDSRQALLNIWKSSPNYLLQQYCEWLREEKHMEISCRWPPV